MPESTLQHSLTAAPLMEFGLSDLSYPIQGGGFSRPSPPLVSPVPSDSYFPHTAREH